MSDKFLRFLYRERYLLWGTVVVSAITALSGAFISAVLGYTGIACTMKIIEWMKQ